MKPHHVLGAVIAAAVLAAVGVVFMCFNKFTTNEWWPNKD